MPDPARLRDSTQIVLPCGVLNGLREKLEADFMITIFEGDEQHCRIIGSPVEIKEVSSFLSRQGVPLQ
ncbi:hypothetical protein [Natronocalculus amylovorans]|uniref:Uncharacterized protein n=1 Tax=Natronocalculus amylovorans TaxID=2917812 RepID=A0AAE3FZU8_9EURY|nr:hypothetical protein [Natronocalculus amylovorans]MCL9817669.1 hypothetical protein [Natronocalculus amylovorans]NUE02230.1 hypothetical protein [Halorubraceae archaeon YAN]